MRLETIDTPKHHIHDALRAGRIDVINQSAKFTKKPNCGLSSMEDTTRSLVARFQLAFARSNCVMRRAPEHFLAKSGIRHSPVVRKRIGVTRRTT